MSLLKSVSIDYEDHPRRLTPEEVDALEIDSIDINVYTYTLKEKYYSLQLLFTPMYVDLMPKAKDLKYIHTDYFKNVDDQFNEKFGIRFLDILNIELSDLTIPSMVLIALDFLKFLHSEFNQIMKPSDILYSRYGKLLQNIDKDSLTKIYKHFHKLVVI